MIKVTLITVGKKLKKSIFAEASVEYEKRLSAYCKLEVKRGCSRKIAARAVGSGNFGSTEE